MKVKLKDVGTIVTGKTPSTKNQKYWNGDICFVTIEDIHTNKNIKSTQRTITKDGFDNLGKNVISGISILVNCVGDIGVVGITELTCATNQQINSITRIKKEYNPYFIYFILQTMKQEMVSLSGQTVLRILPKSVFENIEIDLPDRETQDKIVEILSGIDDQIERNNMIVKRLQDLIHTKYCTMFENKNTPNGCIKDICLLPSGFSFKPEMYCNGGKYKLVTIKNVNDIFVNTEKTDKLSSTPNGMKEYCKLSVGNILMSLTGNVGRISIVTEENNLLNQRVSLLKCDEKYKTYIYALLNSQKYQIIMQKISRGTSQKNLSPIDVENLEIFIPDNIEEFYNETILYFNQMVKIQQNTQHLHNLKKKILPLLINGQLTI